MLARAVAQHLQLDGEALRHAHRVDGERFPPLAGVLGALLQRYLRSELHHITHLQNATNINLKKN